MEHRISTSLDFDEVRIRDAAAAAVLVLAASVAADGAGLMAEPLRIAGVWLLVAVAYLAASCKSHWRVGQAPGVHTPGKVPFSKQVWQWGAVVLMLVVPLGGWTDSLHQVLLVALIAAVLADGRRGAERSMFAAVSLAVLLWSVFLIASRSVPGIWHLAELGGTVLGNVASLLAGSRLRIGASFAAVDLLVLLAILYTIWLCCTAGARLWRAIIALAIVAAVHLGYLCVLARSLDLVDWLPEAAVPTFEHPYTPPSWRWPVAVGTLLPWNLPLLAAVLHVTMLGMLWRWSRWSTAWISPRWECRTCERWTAMIRLPHGAVVLAALGVAVAAAGTLSFGRPDLNGKTLLANSQGRLDWQRPVYDRYGRESAGMFGMLPKMVQSLGGELRVTEQWSEAELSAADAVLLIHPTTELPADQRERIMDYVRRGGALLVIAEPQLRTGDAVSDHNELLRGTSITVRRDVVAPVTSGWQHALLPGSHPVTAGIDRRRNHYFSGIGSSLEIQWPARPLIVGRWGWSDPGSDSLFTGVHRWETGERLGDLVLAAEQRHGRGRILVWGDGHSFSNEGGFRGYWLAGPALSYLVHGTGSPQSGGRQFLTLILAAGLGLVLIGWPEPPRLTAVAVVLALSLACCLGFSRYATRMVPDGRLLAGSEDRIGSRLAYVGASHTEGFSDGAWSFDGIEGLALTLMRSDLLALSLPQLTREHLDRAGVFVSVAPSRPFTARQRRMLVDFVGRGGILICTVGAEEAGASRDLLAEFGIRVPQSPVPTVGDQPEPEPMGRMRAIYLRVEDEDGSLHDLGVNFFAGWPVELAGDDGEILVYGKLDLPLAVLREFGQGSVVVIGDSAFALNKNLEYFEGQPFDGRYDNAHFWRWLLDQLIGDQQWLPPLETAPLPGPQPSQEEQQ
jgi:hypothetical protein